MGLCNVGITLGFLTDLSTTADLLDSVLLSVFAHGLTASPLSKLYSKNIEQKYYIDMYFLMIQVTF